MFIDDLSSLQKGIEAMQAGRNLQALEYFKQALQQDSRNSQAWLGIASLVDDPDRKRFCYQKVLEFDPGNSFAKLSLQEMDAPPDEPMFSFPAPTVTIGSPEPPPVSVGPSVPAPIFEQPAPKPTLGRTSSQKFRRAITVADSIRREGRAANLIALLLALSFLVGVAIMLSWLFV